MPDILPPGNTPAWSPFDPANTIADTWQQEMWPSIWPRLVHPYPNSAELNADLAGLGPADAGLLAYTQNDQTLWVFTGSIFKTVWKESVASNPPRASYDAAWRQTSDGSAITAGNGTETYRWNRDGINVFATGFIVRGSSTTFGGSNVVYAWNLPVTPRDYRAVVGTGYVVDASTGVEYPCILRGTGGLGVSLVLTHNQKRVGNTITGASMPVWDIGDEIHWDVTYEAAS